MFLPSVAIWQLCCARKSSYGGALIVATAVLVGRSRRRWAGTSRALASRSASGTVEPKLVHRGRLQRKGKVSSCT